MTRLYLAGPDVFLEDAVEIGRRKRQLCEQYGFEGLFPLDAELAAAPTSNLSERIYQANLELIRAADGVIANLTPFRGVSADVGTVFELAFARALGKPVFGYSNVDESLKERVEHVQGLRARSDATGRSFAGDDMVVEDFELHDNLMIVECIRAQGWDIVTHAAPLTERMTSLFAFERCLSLAQSIARRQKDEIAA
ncbi:MAG: nucleoside 2-deoxyribosyltransferase [Beijerinckiaceae bacterium]|nr:nucleoside 2-deoxyribosyltransferase [Beijerinckiaceae bacterium]